MPWAGSHRKNPGCGSPLKGTVSIAMQFYIPQEVSAGVSSLNILMNSKSICICICVCMYYIYIYIYVYVWMFMYVYVNK